MEMRLSGHVQHMMIPCMRLEHHVSAQHLWKSPQMAENAYVQLLLGFDA